MGWRRRFGPGSGRGTAVASRLTRLSLTWPTGSARGAFRPSPSYRAGNRPAARRAGARPRPDRRSCRLPFRQTWAGDSAGHLSRAPTPPTGARPWVVERTQLARHCPFANVGAHGAVRSPDIGGTVSEGPTKLIQNCGGTGKRWCRQAVSTMGQWPVAIAVNASKSLDSLHAS